MRPISRIPLSVLVVLFTGGSRLADGASDEVLRATRLPDGQGRAKAVDISVKAALFSGSSADRMASFDFIQRSSRSYDFYPELGSIQRYCKVAERNSCEAFVNRLLLAHEPAPARARFYRETIERGLGAFRGTPIGRAEAMELASREGFSELGPDIAAFFPALPPVVQQNLYYGRVVAALELRAGPAYWVDALHTAALRVCRLRIPDESSRMNADVAYRSAILNVANDTCGRGGELAVQLQEDCQLLQGFAAKTLENVRDDPGLKAEGRVLMDRGANIGLWEQELCTAVTGSVSCTIAGQ